MLNGVYKKFKIMTKLRVAITVFASFQKVIPSALGFDPDF